jgi:Cu/Ag efflux pump CusA
MPIFRISGALKTLFDYDDIYAENESEAEQIAYERALDDVDDYGLDVDDVEFFDAYSLNDDGEDIN